MRQSFIFLFFIFTTSIAALGQSNTSLLLVNDSLRSIQIADFKIKLEALEKKTTSNEEIDNKTYTSISNQLSAVSLSLTIFGILFAIIAIGIGFYVTYVERKIIKIGEENKGLLQHNIQIKNDVVEINRLIQKDIYGLFIKIKREETIHMLERLERVPEDIANLSEQLLSRELEKEDYSKLKEAYTKLSNSNFTYKNKYHLLFFQHFADLSINDLIIKKEMLHFLPIGIQCAFNNDIMKSTNDLFTSFIDKGLSNFKDVLNCYFDGIIDSKYQKYIPVYELIFSKLRNRQSQFLLYQLLDNKLENRIAKVEYGNLLVEKYNTANPTESEKLILNEVEQFKSELKTVAPLSSQMELPI